MKETFRAVVLRLPAHLIERMDGIVYDLHCRSRAAFIRSALQSQIIHHERQLREKATGNTIGTRSERERQHNADIRGRLQDSLILAPQKWSLETLEAIENSQMRRVGDETRKLPTTSVNAQPYLNRHITRSVDALNSEIAKLKAAEAKQ